MAGLLSLRVERGDRLRRAAGGRDFHEPAGCIEIEIDGVTGRPTRAVSVAGEGSDRDWRTTRDWNLQDLLLNQQAQPLPVRRKKWGTRVLGAGNRPGIPFT